MRIRLLFACMGILVCVWMLSVMNSTFAQAPAPQSKAPAAAPAESPSKEQCLGCHGPFDKIAAASANYTAPGGEKVNPHRNVPHDSKKDEDIPSCANCHEAHPLDPLPAHGTVDLSKVNVQWCYEQCHHAKNFTPCKQCHI